MNDAASNNIFTSPKNNINKIQPVVTCTICAHTYKIFVPRPVPIHTLELPMFRSAVRFLGLLARQFQEAPKLQPYLAAKQFIPEDAGRSKRRALRRREFRLKRQIIRDVNNLKKQKIKFAPFEVDPVLGADNVPFITRLRRELNEPLNLAQGYKREEVEKLFYGAQKAVTDSNLAGDMFPESVAAKEEKKRNAVLTILNLRNTSAKDKKKMAVDFARKEFQRYEGDSGSPEVQAAVMTAKIHLNFNHLKANKKDHSHTEAIRHLVNQRQRVLKYLKRVDPERYYYTLAKLGLTDDVITREFSMGYQYFEDYKVWGDRELVKKSEKTKKKQEQLGDLEKRVADYNKLAKKNYDILYGQAS